MNKKGFTLIELLVVIAIIGILASVVLTQVNSARDKTLDTAIKSDLTGIRTGATVLYDTLSNKFGTIAIAGVDCEAPGTAYTTGPTGNSIFGDPNIKLALSHIKKSNGGTSGTADLTKLYCNADAAGTGYAVVAKLKSTANFVCTDGAGALKTTSGTTANAYDGTIAGLGVTYPALTDSADLSCN